MRKQQTWSLCGGHLYVHVHVSTGTKHNLENSVFSSLLSSSGVGVQSKVKMSQRFRMFPLAIIKKLL